MNLFDDKFYSGAEFSPDRKYRYALWRIWDKDKPLVMFIGLNPSTANENDTPQGNDNTITKVKKIARNNGYGGVYMMNLFPLVSTDPDKLVEFYNTFVHDEQDAKNRRMLVEIAVKCRDIVYAWGSFKQAELRGKTISAMFPASDHIFCLHINKNGSPKHPLYCRDDSKLIKYRP